MWLWRAVQLAWFRPDHDAAADAQVPGHFRRQQTGIIQALAAQAQVIVAPERVGDDFGQAVVVEGIHDPMLSRERAVNSVAGGRVAFCWRRLSPITAVP